MIDRRAFVAGSAAAGMFIMQDALREALADDGKDLSLRDAARKRGIEIGACMTSRHLAKPAYEPLLRSGFTLAANLFEEMEWDANPGFGLDPTFFQLRQFVEHCERLGLRPRARQVYSREALPRNAHLRRDGTPKNKSELEKTLITRVQQCCTPLKGKGAIIQVIDELLADKEGGLRKDPFTDAFGEHLADILFHAAHEVAPDALLTYQEYGPELDPYGHFKRKTRDLLRVMEQLRKRNVPITGLALGGFIPPLDGGLVVDTTFLKRVQNLDYDIHVNELTVIYGICGSKWKWRPPDKNHDRIVSKYYTEAFQRLCKFKRLKEISFFAPFDGDNTVETGTLCVQAYAGARPGIFSRDHARKSVYHSIAKAVAASRATI